MVETQGISAILQKDKEGKYTDNALLYQDILHYSIINEKQNQSNTNTTFKVWDLAKWLIENNVEFANYYKDSPRSHTTMNNRIEARMERIKDKINNLQTMGLIQTSGTAKASKVDTNIPIFGYTEFGYLIAWLVESDNPRYRERAINEIYNFFQSNFTQDLSSSYDILMSKVFEKEKKKGIFANYVDMLRKSLHASPRVRDIQEFFAYVDGHYFEDREAAKNHTDIWFETIDELEEETKMLFLHREKLAIEELMAKKVGSVRGYEKMRYRIRDKPDLVAIEGLCEKCNYYFHAAVEMLHYMRQMVYLPLKERLNYTCPQCGSASIFNPKVWTKEYQDSLYF